MIRILKLLFVCTANIDLSPGEDIFKGQPGFEVRAHTQWLKKHEKLCNDNKVEIVAR
jgi:hypothetical protein